MKKDNFIIDSTVSIARKFEKPKKWKTHYNRNEFPEDKGEVNNMPSMTIPDQSMTIPEIIDRFVRGIPVNVGKVPIYDEGEDLLDGINPQTMDIVEKKAFVSNTKDELYSLNQKIQNDEKRRKQADYKDITDNKTTKPEDSKKSDGDK